MNCTVCAARGGTACQKSFNGITLTQTLKSALHLHFVPHAPGNVAQSAAATYETRAWQRPFLLFPHMHAHLLLFMLPTYPSRISHLRRGNRVRNSSITTHLSNPRKAPQSEQHSPSHAVACASNFSSSSSSFTTRSVNRLQNKTPPHTLRATARSSSGMPFPQF